jgi:cell division initiation protein
MNLSPLDIAKHEFSKAMRGYDPAEVRAFLERLADDVSALQTQIASLVEQTRTYEAKINTYQNLEQSLRDSVVASQENIKSTRELVEAERQNMLREAKVSAEEMRISAEREILGLQEEVRSLRMHRDAYIKRFKFLLRSQGEILSLIESDDPEEPLTMSPSHTSKNKQDSGKATDTVAKASESAESQAQ